jgi:DNA-binding NarL/FixJ family response regulator
MTEQLTAAEATDSGRHPRVVLADDDVLLREGRASLLERSGLEVVGQAGDPMALLGLVREHKPDLVIVDIRMPPTQTTEGLEAARQIREELPDTAVVVLSAYVQVDEATALLASGQRSDYLLKSRVIVVADFIDTLHRILRTPRSWTRGSSRSCSPSDGPTTKTPVATSVFDRPCAIIRSTSTSRAVRMPSWRSEC